MLLTLGAPPGPLAQWVPPAPQDPLAQQEAQARRPMSQAPLDRKDLLDPQDPLDQRARHQV